MENKNNVIVWILIVLAVVVFLVFLTLGDRGDNPDFLSEENTEEVGLEENNKYMEKEGVKISIIQEGEGKVAESGSLVSMNYTGKLENGSVFDSNVLPEFGHVEPFVFPLGAGQVIRGWDIGIEGMKVGEKRILEIAPEYAYGERGAGERIPPNSTLIFEVELVDIIQ